MGPFQVHQLQLVSPSLPYSTASLVSWRVPSVCVFFFFFSFSFFVLFFVLWSAGKAKSTRRQFSSFLLIIARSGLLAVNRWSFCIIIIIIYSSRVFHISISWWFFTGVWVTASLLKSSELVSVFWPSSAMLSFWIVSTRPLTYKSSRPFNNPLVTVPNAPITIGTIVTFMFHSFFNSLARSRYLFFFSLSFRILLWSAGTAKSTILQILFLFLIIMRSGLLAGIRWSVCILKSHYYYYYYFTDLRVFHTSVSRWFLTVVWVVASLLRSPGLF